MPRYGNEAKIFEFFTFHIFEVEYLREYSSKTLPVYSEYLNTIA